MNDIKYKDFLGLVTFKLYHTAVKVLITACTAIFEYLVTLDLIFMVTLHAGDILMLVLFAINAYFKEFSS